MPEKLGVPFLASRSVPIAMILNYLGNFKRKCGGLSRQLKVIFMNISFDFVAERS